MKNDCMRAALAVGAVLWASAVAPIPNGATLQKGK